MESPFCATQTTGTRKVMYHPLSHNQQINCKPIIGIKYIPFVPWKSHRHAISSFGDALIDKSDLCRFLKPMFLSNLHGSLP